MKIIEFETFLGISGSFFFSFFFNKCFVFVSAILAVKEESIQCAVPRTLPVLEEFIPLKKERDDDDEEEDNFRKGKDYRDQKNWMSSVQLWNSDDNHHHSTNYSYDRKRDSKFETKV